MAYTPTTWTNDTPASTPVKYVITDDTVGEIAASATIAPVTSITPGTAMDADHLNNIEDGIVTLESDLADLAALVAVGVPDIFAAKGDLAVGVAADSALRLAVGADNKYLVADSSQTTGLKWQTMFTTGRWTNANWDGDSQSGAHTFTLLTDFSVPNAARMVLVYLAGVWNSPTTNSVIVFEDTPSGSLGARYLAIQGQVASIPAMACGWVPVAAGGQLRLAIGSDIPAGVWVEISAYML